MIRLKVKIWKPRLYGYILSIWVHYYARKQGFVISGHLKQDLDRRNYKALRWVVYALRRNRRIPGVIECFEELSTVSIKNNDTARIYHNSLTEFHALCFVEKSLGFRVTELESRTRKIHSPFRKKEKKSCDIKALDNSGVEKYFEVKDASRETMTQRIENDNIFFSPAAEEEIENWIKGQTIESGICGAQYLICRVPFWSDTELSREYFMDEWPKTIFKKHFAINGKQGSGIYRLSANFSRARSLLGIYVLKEFAYLSFNFESDETET
jgi:hypothetical protein